MSENTHKHETRHLTSSDSEDAAVGVAPVSGATVNGGHSSGEALEDIRSAGVIGTTALVAAVDNKPGIISNVS